MSTHPSALSRASTSKSPGVSLQSPASTLISTSATLAGNYPITLGAYTILQPRSRLSSITGPIDIDEGCIIAERACIGLSVKPVSEHDQQLARTGVELGKGVFVESGAVIHAAFIGAYTIIEAGAKVGNGAVVGQRCRICAKVEVGTGTTVQDRTVVYGNAFGEGRVEKEGGVMDERREEWIEGHGEALRRTWTGK